MTPQGPLGLQWKLAAILLGVNLAGTGIVAGGYYLGIGIGLQPTAALAVGLAAGLAAGVFGSLVGIMVARSLKLRLWEAADMAQRIARGDLRVRLPAEVMDEVGWLEEQLNQMAGQLETAMADLRHLAEENRLLAQEARRGAALEERARLARDLHDTVNQQLFVLAMRTAAARKRLEKLGGEATALAPELNTLEELARQAHSETRGLILQLRPTTLEQQGLGAALDEYVRGAAQRDGWEYVADIDMRVRLDGAQGASLFRVAQECLNNISKHAQANRVWVALHRTPDGIVLRIRDDGIGFDVKAGVRPTAVGLLGIRERMEAEGGRVQWQSAPGEGTEVIVMLSLLKQEE